ncbi:MAG: hypothetical protein BWY78_01152 [Alphaproteobacteria bacterium ADurb.Bin438]|nr:MAG: hypothetical protein BWY78_01152 [Alphaproteobacteria bacterium ADurb.Bin438]
MKTFYDIILLCSNAPWSGTDGEPDGFLSVERPIKQAIQMAHSFIWNSYDFPFKFKKQTFETIATVKSYLKPKGQIVKVWINGVYLSPMEDVDLIDNTLGLPTHYGVNEENELILHPIPDKVYEVNVKYKTSLMAKNLQGEEKYNLEAELDTLNIPEDLEDLYIQALITKFVVNYIADNVDEGFEPYKQSFEIAYNNLINEVKPISNITTIIL